MLPFFFVAVLILSALVVLAATRPSRAEMQISSRVAAIRNPRRSLAADEAELQLAPDAAGTPIKRLDLWLRHYSVSCTIARWILEADSQDTVGSLVLKSGAVLLISGVATLLLSASLSVSAAAAIAGLILPLAMLRVRRARRLHAMTAALPDTADLLARALRAGHSMTQAFEVLAERAPPPLANEFSRIFQQQSLGVPLREVLLGLGRRVPLKELQFLTTAILVQRETGGDLAEILDRTAKTLRERARIQGEVRVHTTQGRLTGWILSLLPLGLLAGISLFSPGYCSILFTDPLGRLWLYGCAGCILVGGLVIRRIVQVNF